MSVNIAHRDALYLFVCHLEWRTRRTLAAYHELLAGLDDNEADIRTVARLCCAEAHHGECEPRQVSKLGEVEGRFAIEDEWHAICSFVGRCTMATLALNSQLQSLIGEYGVFWQIWPQFDQTNGERRLAGFEVELIASHKCDRNHVDPSCPRCRDVRAVLLAIADLMPGEFALGQNPLIYDIDSHSNSILCLPALGNRSAVSVSIYVSWSRANGPAFETDLLNGIKTSLHSWGIHQR